MINSVLQRLKPNSAASPPGRDLALEGVRGLCAALVFYAHLFLPLPVLDLVVRPSSRFLPVDLNQGHPAVLFFFVISGYVIGLVTCGPATGQGIRHYLRHRAARLVPLNTFAVLLSWMLLTRTDWQTVAGNLLFLQNDAPYPLLGSFPLLLNNPNLWSLNFEVVYYLGFIVLWVWPQRVGLIFAGLILLVGAYSTGLPIPRILAHYACGALYWLGGLGVAWLTARPKTPASRSNWPVAVLSGYALWVFVPLHTMLTLHGVRGWTWTSTGPLSPDLLDFLPACLWLLLAVTGRALTAQRWLMWACLVWATFGFILQTRLSDWPEYNTVGAIALIVAWGTMKLRCPLRLLQWLAPLGAVSYGIYVLGGPIQLGQQWQLPGFSGTSLTFTARLVFVVTLVGALAWLLERRVCPPVGRLIRGKKDPTGASRK